MNMYNMKLEQFQVNTKSLNTLPPEWSKFVTDFKLIEYAQITYNLSEFSSPETGLVVLVFQKGDDPIDAINHMMSFLTSVVASRYPVTNNQLRISSNPRQQATINNGRADDLDAYDSECDELNSAKTESSAEQAFWSNYSVQTDEPNLSGTTIVEVPKELPKVSMVNSCLKRLKFHLTSFDMVVKERTTATTITEGTWGFEHTKACFRDDIIPFVKKVKELFTSFDQCLIGEVTEVQNIFKQIELAVEQHCAEKTKFQTKMENVLQENYRLLTQALSVEIVNIVVHDNVKFDFLNVDAYAHGVTTESELKPNFIKEECYETLLQQYHILETHCISLEVNNQLNTEIFQRDTVSSPESAPTFAELFEINDLKAQVQEKDTVILKLKEKLNSLSSDVKVRKVKREVEEIETLNLELDHKVTKLAAENEHLKQTYKQLYDSIKSLRVQSKEQCDDLINKVNLKSAEVSDLNANLQEKVLVDVAPLVPKLRKNRTTHTDYIRHTQEEATTLREIVESERLLSPLNTSLAYACKYTRRIQELLMILQQTCTCITNLGTKLVAVTPKNKTKQIRRTA
nr:hypothetical protein [Tanacetum cinerariifolium]